MKVLFYSKSCNFSNELINKLKDTNFTNEFKLINVDVTTIPDKIKVVPTIIDPEYKDLLEGKKAFEYIFNKKYFDNPTNNLLFWKDKNVPKLDIKEDNFAKETSKAIDNVYSEFKTETTQLTEPVVEKQEQKKIRINRSNLLKIKGRG
tara:strand:+ start:294 stop:737 length:444 start_codon:yes stop_codon:yes gene_type:complete